MTCFKPFLTPDYVNNLLFTALCCMEIPPNRPAPVILFFVFCLIDTLCTSEENLTMDITSVIMFF